MVERSERRQIILLFNELRFLKPTVAPLAVLDLVWKLDERRKEFSRTVTLLRSFQRLQQYDMSNAYFRWVDLSFICISTGFTYVSSSSFEPNVSDESLSTLN